MSAGSSELQVQHYQKWPEANVSRGWRHHLEGLVLLILATWQSGCLGPAHQARPFLLLAPSRFPPRTHNLQYHPSNRASLVRDHGHPLGKAAGADALLNVLRFGGHCCHHHGAGVAPQRVTQHHGEHAVAVGDVGAALLQRDDDLQGRAWMGEQSRAERGAAVRGCREVEQAPACKEARNSCLW